MWHNLHTQEEKNTFQFDKKANLRTFRTFSEEKSVYLHMYAFLALVDATDTEYCRKGCLGAFFLRKAN